MSDALDPGFETLDRVVALLRADTALHSLLFDAPAPAVVPGGFDARVYAADADLPSEVRDVLPRVIVETYESDFPTEQETSVKPLARVNVLTHSFAESGQRMLAEQISARCRVVLGGSHPSGSNVFGAPLVPLPPRPTTREAAFRDAWRATREFRSALVGVT